MALEIVRLHDTDAWLPWESPEETELFGGDLQDICLNTLVQLAQAESISGAIRVHERGEVALLKGRITGATCGSLQGIEALRELMFLREGRYSVLRGDPPEASPLEGVLYAIMDGYRMREEWARVGELVLRPRGGEQWHFTDQPFDRVAHALDGRRTVAEIVAEQGVDVTVILDALLDALNIGLIEPAPARAPGPANSAPGRAPAPETTTQAKEPVRAAGPAPAKVPAPRAIVTELVTVAPAPPDVDTLLENARTCVRAGELDVAEAMLRRALELRPNDRVAAQNLRAVLRRREAAHG